MRNLIIVLALLFLVNIKASTDASVTKADSFWPETSYHGFINVSSPTGKIFYWYFPSRDSVETDPWVLWLTGGPGCSSEIAILTENGPFSLKDDETLVTNPYSWNSKANLIFIDNPLGTGLSYPNSLEDIPTTEYQIANDVYQFLTKLQKLYPHFNGDKAFYLTGESYAGHYLPNIANFLVEKQDKSINLKGVAIGNGMVTPKIQYMSILPFSINNGLISNPFDINLCNKFFPRCKNFFEENSRDAIPYCNQILDFIQCPRSQTSNNSNCTKNFNTYNIDIQCEVKPLCYDFSRVKRFMNSDRVKKALEEKYMDREFKICESNVQMALMKDMLIDAG